MAEERPCRLSGLLLATLETPLVVMALEAPGQGEHACWTSLQPELPQGTGRHGRAAFSSPRPTL